MNTAGLYLAFRFDPRGGLRKRSAVLAWLGPLSLCRGGGARLTALTLDLFCGLAVQTHTHARTPAHTHTHPGDGATLGTTGSPRTTLVLWPPEPDARVTRAARRQEFCPPAAAPSSCGARREAPLSEVERGGSVRRWEGRPHQGGGGGGGTQTCGEGTSQKHLHLGGRRRRRSAPATAPAAETRGSVSE